MSGAFDRMSSREKMLVSVLVGLVLILGVGGVYLVVSSDVSDLEVEVDEARDKLARLRALAPKYMAATAKTRRFRSLARANDSLKLELEINRIAKAISFDKRNSRGDLSGDSINLAGVLNYPGKSEKFLGPKPKKKKRGKKGKQDKVGYFRIDEPIRVGDYIPFDKLYQFLDRIEMTEKMLFVTRLDMRRLRQDGEVAQTGAAFTVSTYVYRGGEDEAEAEAPEETPAKGRASRGGK